MYRTPIKSKIQNKTSMIKAMEPFRDSQTPYWFSGYRGPDRWTGWTAPLIGPAWKYVNHEEVKPTIFNSEL